MNVDVPISADQVRSLAPLLCQRGSHVLVGNIFPNGHGWTLAVRALPGERRDAIRAACKGELKLPRHRSKSTTRKAAKPI